MQNKTILATSLAILFSSVTISASAAAISVAPSFPMIVDVPNSTGSSISYGNNPTIFGQGNTCFSDNCLILGNNSVSGIIGSVISNSIVIGHGSTNTVDEGFVLGHGATNNGVNGGAIGNGSVNNVANNISIGGRTLGSVGQATTSDQAVNLGQVQGLINGIPSGVTQQQLQSAQVTTLGQANATAQGMADAAQSNAITQANGYTDSKQAATLTQANSYTDTAKSTAVTQSNAYTDSKQATTLNQANTYATAIVVQSYQRSINYTDAVAASTLSSANSYTDQKTNVLQNQIGALDKRLSGIDRKYAGAIASVAAASSAPFVPGKTVVTGGVGYYSGQSAVGFSFTASQNATTGVRGGVSISQAGGVVLSAGFIKVF